MININIEAKELKRIEDMLITIPNGMERAMSSAINRTLTSTRASAVRRVRSQYDVRAGDIRGSMHISRSNIKNISGSIISKGGTLPLIDFKVNPKKPNPRRRKPVFASVKKSGGAIEGAFVAKMPNGHIGVYERAGISRYPIKQLYGPSAPQMLGNKNILDGLSEEAEETMLQRLSHETVRLLRRY